MNSVRAKNLIILLVANIIFICVNCGEVEQKQAQPPNLDYNYFVSNVQPVLEQSCAFLACHGDNSRPFRLYAVNRLREIENPSPLERIASLTPSEIQSNFDSAIALAYGEFDLEESLILIKPLDEDAGGTWHRGAKLYGDDDVFLSKADGGYQIIKAWLEGASSGE